jgi:hypothetical protein
MERPLDQSYPIFPRTPVPSLMSFTSCMRKLHTTYAKTSSSTLHPSVLPSHSPQLATSTPTSLRRTSPSTPLPTRGASRTTHIRAIRLANTRITRTRIQRVVSALFLSCSFGLLGARLVGVKGSIGVRGLSESLSCESLEARREGVVRRKRAVAGRVGRAMRRRARVG